MQTPEQFAVAVTEHCPEVSDGMCFHSAPVGRCIDLKTAADLIRARDAEVRADERDAGVAQTWEALAVSQFGRNQAMREQMRRLYVESRDGMAVLADEALVDELVRRGVLTEETRAFIREPWECANPAHALHNHRGGFGEDCTFAPDATQRRHVTAWEEQP